MTVIHRCRWSRLQYAPGRVVSRYPAHSTPASCARPADQDFLILGLDSPGANVGLCLCPGPLQRPVEDVAARQSEINLEVDRGPGLKTKVTPGVAQDDVLDGLGQN